MFFRPCRDNLLPAPFYWVYEPNTEQGGFFMEHISFFSSDGQPQSPERPGAVGLDAGEVFPVHSATKEDEDIDEDIMDWLLDGAYSSDEEADVDAEDDEEEEDDLAGETTIDAAIDASIEDREAAIHWKNKVNDALDEWEVDGEDNIDDMDLEALLEMLSRHEDQRKALLRRVQSELREELNRRAIPLYRGEMTHYSEGHRKSEPAFFVLSTHFDLSITLEDRPHCCVPVQGDVSHSLRAGDGAGPADVASPSSTRPCATSAGTMTPATMPSPCGRPSPSG